MIKRWIVTATGKDQPGIVAGVSEILYRQGCNLEDSAMTRLEGEFAIMLIVSAPAAMNPKRMAQALGPLERSLKLSIHVRLLGPAATRAPKSAGTSQIISVYGADKPGIVFRVSQALAAARVNITDVQTHRTPQGRKNGNPPLYMLLLEVEVPASVQPEALEKTLKRLAGELGVEVSMRLTEANVL
jgi:glycine cleavage system transcriptional repressor